MFLSYGLLIVGVFAVELRVDRASIKGQVEALAQTGGSPAFALVAGITAAEEQCLSVAGGAVHTAGAEVTLESCLSSIAAGDGRELWQFRDNGELENVVGKKCIEVAGAKVLLGECGHGSSFDVTESGQLRLRSKDACLSQKGSFAGDEDIALKSPVHASSASDEFHGGYSAVDGQEASFWSSAANPAGSVSIEFDFGEARHLKAVEIDWEHPAESFSIEVSQDGQTWATAFSTDVNSVFGTHEDLGFALARKARVVMKKTHPLYGLVAGRKYYAARRISFIAPRLTTIVEPCAAAAASHDARDRYFLSSIGQFDTCPAKEIRAALGGLNAARVGAAAVVSKLANRLPSTGACRGAALASVGASDMDMPSLVSVSRRGKTEIAAMKKTSGLNADTGAAAHKASELIATMNGISGAEIGNEIGAAKGVVIAARKALKR